VRLLEPIAAPVQERDGTCSHRSNLTVGMSYPRPCCVQRAQRPCLPIPCSSLPAAACVVETCGNRPLLRVVVVLHTLRVLGKLLKVCSSNFPCVAKSCPKHPTCKYAIVQPILAYKNWYLHLYKYGTHEAVRRALHMVRFRAVGPGSWCKRSEAVIIINLTAILIFSLTRFK
jgi:hypothetical protein